MLTKTVLAQLVFQFMGQRLGQLIEEVTFQKLDQRLASILLNRGPVLHVTHQQLADELGSVREVVSRLLHDFKDQGAVEIQRGKLRILNPAVLEQVSTINRDISH